MAFRCSGFTYLALLVFIFLIGIGLSATGVVFHQQAQREKEKQLLYAGDQFRRAIGLYYERSPGGIKRFPPSLNDLLKDERFLTTQRYLRRIYIDPMTGADDWVPMRAPDGGLIGVHSAKTDMPIKTGAFSPPYESFKDKTSYAEWEFRYAVETPPGSTGPATENKPRNSLPAGGDSTPPETRARPPRPVR